jgi:flagellar biosynthesis/type III secretory pathway protein FliH
MENSSKINQLDHTLLMVISSKMDTILEDVKEIKDELKLRVHLNDFNELKRSFEEHKKETGDKITSHTVKIAIGTGILTAISWLLRAK